MKSADEECTSSKRTSSGVTVYRRLCLGMLMSGFLLLILTAISYNISGTLTRLVLVGSFLVAFCCVVFASLGRSSRLALMALLLTSYIFLLWRFSFLMPTYVEKAVNSETNVFMVGYGQLGRLAFGSAHSYFFGPYYLLFVLQSVIGLSGSEVLYFSVFVYGSLTALVATLVLRAILRKIERAGGYRPARSVLAASIAFSAVAFMYTSRSAIRAGFPQLYGLVVLLAVFLVLGRGLKSRSNMIIEFFLVVGLTLGSADGVLLMVPFFSLFSVLGRKEAASYALIPLAYMILSAYSYVGSLLYYGTFAWGGFFEFIAQLMSNDISSRIFPWGRVLSITRQDAFVESLAYISFMLLCLSVAVVSTFISLRTKQSDEKDPDILAGVRSSSVCLWIMLVIAGVTYVGASIRPETFSSDIRTIAIVLPALLLLIPFMSTRLISAISAKRLLVAAMILLMILGSLTGIYETYPKSADDPINVIEDGRLGSTSVIMAAEHIGTYGAATKIVADYKLLRLGGNSLGSAEHDEGWFNEMANGSFGILGEGGILAFNVGGAKYPSIYHPSQAYAEAYKFSVENNRVYDNGVVVIALARG